jgi:hypothetical protein
VRIDRTSSLGEFLNRPWVRRPIAVLGDVHGGIVVHQNQNHAQLMEDINTQELNELVELIAAATELDLDELLTDFLVGPYPTKRAQDN